MRVEGDIILIENQLLCAAIWGDTSCINLKPQFTGYVQANVDKAGRAFIEYCIARVYGIFRLPKCGYDNYINSKIEYYTLKEEDISDACKELEAVINHVQSKLNLSGKVKDDKISVVRCLSAFQVPMVTSQLIDKNINEIEFPVSIFSSYSYDGDISQNYPSGRENYEKHINIKEDISVEQIILWDKYVGNGQMKCPYVKSMFDSECELWVIDKGISGMRKLPRSSFYYTNGLPEERSNYRTRSDFGIDEPVHNGAYKKRPCEYKDWITKTCIKKNLRKMQKEEDIFH